MDLSKPEPEINTTYSVNTIAFIWTNPSPISVLIVLTLGDGILLQNFIQINALNFCISKSDLRPILN